jgi:PTH1 family peptidyl-tRNA hydrolase
MKVIVGLGNPGVEYTNTRHNAGILLVERIAQRLASDYGWRRHKEAFVFETPEITLAKTAGKFMNESGLWVNLLIKNSQFTIDNLYLAHDDLDLKIGEYKIQRGVGPKVHYGVQSVEQLIGEKDFWRIRIGVDNRDPLNRAPGDQYVLQKFSEAEKRVLDSILERIADEVLKTAD